MFFLHLHLFENSSGSEELNYHLSKINRREQVKNHRFFSVDECVIDRRSFGIARGGTSSVSTGEAQMLLRIAALLSLITLQLCTMCPALAAVNAVVCLYV